MTETTFTTLALHAGGQLDSALGTLRVLPARPHDEIAPIVAQHADLSAALAQLGRTILGTGTAASAGGNARLIAELQLRACPLAWTEPVPDPGTVAGLMRAGARSSRAAGELWATHHSPDGRPRSPEASRLRHPSMRGAAVRHWRALVTSAGAIAQALAEQPAVRALAPELRTSVVDYPQLRRRAAALPDVPVRLARPPVRPAADPFTAVGLQLDRIHRHLWNLADRGQFSAAVLVNAAAIGMLMARALVDAERECSRQGSGAAASGRPGSSGGPVGDAGVGARHLEGWAGVAGQLAMLRTPHSGRTVLQLERLDLARLLDRLAGHCVRGGGDGPEAVCELLARACSDYSRVAPICARAVRSLHAADELFMLGRALPGSLVARRHDLLADKLANRVVPAPTGVARRLEVALHAIAAEHPRRSSGSAA